MFFDLFIIRSGVLILLVAGWLGSELSNLIILDFSSQYFNYKHIALNNVGITQCLWIIASLILINIFKVTGSS